VTSEGLFEETGGLRFLRRNLGESRFIRISTDPADQATFLPPNLGVPFGLNDAQGYREQAPRDYLDLLARIEQNRNVMGVPNLREPASLLSPILDLIGVRYAVAKSPLPVAANPVYPDCEAGQAPPKADMYIYERPDPFPRAFVAKGRRFFRDSSAAIDAVLADPRAARNFAFAEGGSAGDAKSEGTPAKIVRREGGEVEVDVGAASGFLVLTDQFLPGWSATCRFVSGEERASPVFRTHGCFIGVEVPEGTKTVLLSYDADRSAAFISLLGWLVVAGGWIRLALSRRPGAGRNGAA
jgi:hypothetical protein